MWFFWDFYITEFLIFIWNFKFCFFNSLGGGSYFSPWPRSSSCIALFFIPELFFFFLNYEEPSKSKFLFLQNIKYHKIFLAVKANKGSFSLFVESQGHLWGRELVLIFVRISILGISEVTLPFIVGTVTWNKNTWWLWTVCDTYRDQKHIFKFQRHMLT